MSRHLLNRTETYAVDTLAEVDILKEELLNDDSFELGAFGYKTKIIKSKGEILAEYQLVTAKKVYDNERDIYAP